MAFSSWQRHIVDWAGNTIPNAAIEVRREADGAPAACFADRDGTVPLGSIFNADAEGYVRFYTAGGFYRIRAAIGDAVREWRDVPIGNMQAFDVENIPGFLRMQPTDLVITVGEERRLSDAQSGPPSRHRSVPRISCRCASADRRPATRRIRGD